MRPAGPLSPSLLTPNLGQDQLHHQGQAEEASRNLMNPHLRGFNFKLERGLLVTARSGLQGWKNVKRCVLGMLLLQSS
eukprot:1772129-Rhodomonas_salina.2